MRLQEFLYKGPEVPKWVWISLLVVAAVASAISCQAFMMVVIIIGMAVDILLYVASAVVVSAIIPRLWKSEFGQSMALDAPNWIYSYIIGVVILLGIFYLIGDTAGDYLSEWVYSMHGPIV